MSRGFFAIGIENGKRETNMGMLWRSANLYDAAFVFTVGRRYAKQCSDTMNTPDHVPLLHFTDMDDLIEHLPSGCPLVGVELDDRSTPLRNFVHPERACYLLGAEDNGLSRKASDRCHQLVQIEAAKPYSMNVAVAGSLVLYDRFIEQKVSRAAAPS